MRTFVHRDLPANSSDFRLMSRDAVEALGHLREGQRFLRGMVTWIGFPQVAVPFERPSRAAGTTKYSTRKMVGVRLGRDPVLLDAAAAFRDLLRVHHLRDRYDLRRACLLSRPVLSRPGARVGDGHRARRRCSGGAILVCLGMVGEYVGRIYEEIKQRPIYIVRRRMNM